MITIVCPQCNKDDTIQKVSAIVTGQPADELAIIFAAPSKPNR